MVMALRLERRCQESDIAPEVVGRLKVSPLTGSVQIQAQVVGDLEGLDARR